MRAVAINEPQGQAKLVDVPKPTPKDDQLLVQVAASGLNPFDWKQADRAFRGNVPGVSPFILGVDAAGTVAEVGDNVTRFKVGDRVFGQFTHAPFGEGTDAEFAVVPENGAIAKLPDDVDFELAAALPTAGMTAMSLLETMGLSQGSTLLIVGATGGVGSYATQLAAAKGLRVLVTSDASEAQRMRDLGAADIIDHTKGRLLDQIKQLAPNGVDGIIDLVSDASTFDSLTSLVRPGGHIFTTIGAANPNDLKAKNLKGGNFLLHGTSDLLERLANAVRSGKLKVPVEATISLEELPAAIARSRQGRSRGKTVVRISPPAQQRRSA